MNLITIIIVCLLVALICLIVFWMAFGEIPVPVICEIFPTMKETLVRHYACSLALCVRGCDWVENYEFCIERDCSTRECTKKCKDYCTNAGKPSHWPSLYDEGGKMCGRPYYIDVPLQGDIGFEGVYKCEYAGVLDTNCYTEINDIIDEISQDPDEDFPTFEDILDCASWSYIKYGCNDDNEPRAYTCAACNVYPGILANDKEYKKCGMGDVYLDPNVALESFGCSDASVPYSLPLPPYDQPGYYSCAFSGNLKLWSDYLQGSSDECADAFLNTTVGRWWFEIRIRPYSQVIGLGATADYTITIENHLGSGADFQISYFFSGMPYDPNCVFPDGESTYTLSVPNDGTEQTTMSCTPTNRGEYGIAVKGKPNIGLRPRYAYAKLKVMDFYFWVIPSYRHRGINERADYTVKILNLVGSDRNFYLSYNQYDDVSCEFPNGEGTYTLTVPDRGYEETTLTCWAPTQGIKDIVVSAVSDGLDPQTDNIQLIVGECMGRVYSSE